MSEPYRVSYSERVRQELLRLAARARAAGRGPEFLAAVKELDRWLHVYPQFGEPLGDLSVESLQIWIAAVPPLVVRYALDEKRRQVIVASLPTLLPGTGY